MDRDMNQFVPQNGMTVVGADGEKVGDIDGVEQDYFIVRKGFFFPQDHYIPMTAISSYDDDQVYLNVTKDQTLEQGWTNPPVADTSYVETATPPANQGYDANDATIQVHEEELAARTREVERGKVRIDKNVVQEQQTLEVPVTEEEVNVTRHRVDRAASADAHAFEEGTIRVPLRGEEVEIEKRARVVEEIDVDKAARTHTERVSDSVRREEVTIEGDNVNFDRDNTRRRNNDADPV